MTKHPASLKTYLITKEELPLVIESTDQNMTLPAFLELLQNENDFFRESLLKHGGLLFRNFPLNDAHDFAAAIKSLQLGKFINYIGGDSPRNKIVDGVYTSTEAPPSIKIPLHNELSYVKNYPKHIYFFCEIPPKANGQTTIADARKIYQAIDPAIRERFIEKGLQYISCYPYKSALLDFINRSHKSWLDVFETHDKSEVERLCRENDFSFAWNKNDWLQLSQKRPATLLHPETQEPVWFNQAHHFDLSPKLIKLWRYLGVKLLYCRKHTLLHNILFADGTQVPRSDLYYIMDLLDDHTLYFSWQKGDLLVLDNILSMHGRATFTGKRRILTAMTG